MCFSAQASFISSAALALIGSYTIVKARHFPRVIPFATIPILFAAQQACEGVVWLGLNNPTLSYLLPYAIIGFLFFATVIWPLWIPTSLLLLEKKRCRFKMILSCCVIGSLLSFIYTWNIITQPQTAYAINHHITYQLLADPLGNIHHMISIILYTYAVVVPFFISTIYGMRMVGMIITLGWLTALAGYYQSFGSVWCFFAACASIMAWWIIGRVIKTS
jgi:hypothetical protein